MRKLYKYLTFAALAIASVAAKAEDFKLPTDNTVLMSEKYNMRLFKTWDFIGLTMNGKPITPETFTTGAEDASMPLCDGYKPVMVTNEGMKGWYMGIGNIEFNKDKGGLYNNKNGIRYVILQGLKEGEIICIQNGAASEKLAERIYKEDGTYEEVKVNDYAVNACRIQKQSPDGKFPAWTISYLDNQNQETWYNTVVEITAEIHEEQAKLDPPATEQTENEGTEGAEGGEGEEGTEETPTNVDEFRYFRVIKDGPLYIAMGKNASIQGLQIWLDANAEESVSIPTFELVGAGGESRDITITCGESTLGADCHIEIGFPEEDGYEGASELYEEESLNVSYTDDYNEDGKVTIEAVTVSSTGAKSEPARIEVDVNEIQLNAPTLTLVGFKDEFRTYEIGWTDNTIKNAPVQFTVSGDDDSFYIEDAKIGSTYDVKENLKVTVSSNGYAENTTSIDADMPGVTIVRKGEAEGHDIDFTKPTEEIANLLKDKAVESCYLEAEDGTKTYYTYDEYVIGEAADGTSLANAKPVYTVSGWTWDGNTKHMRATLNVVKDSVLEGDTYTYTYSYTDGLKFILPEGIKFVNGPRESDGASQVLYYFGNFNLGLTFMISPTLTFDRSIAKAGEIVVLTIAAGGGSTYMTYDSENNALVRTLVYVVPTTEPLTVKLPNPATGFCHLLNIDFYTYDNLPTDQYDPTSVNAIATDATATPVAIYSVSGAKVDALQKGINIIKMSDGSVKKIIK